MQNRLVRIFCQGCNCYTTAKIIKSAYYRAVSFYFAFACILQEEKIRNKSSVLNLLEDSLLSLNATTTLETDQQDKDPYYFYDEGFNYKLGGDIIPEVDPSNLTFTTSPATRIGSKSKGLFKDQRLGTLNSTSTQPDSAGGSAEYLDTYNISAEDYNLLYGDLEEILSDIEVTNSLTCPFVATSDSHVAGDWVYKAPIFLLLACNMIFLIWIMKVSKDFFSIP